MKAITSHDLANGAYTNHHTYNNTHSIKSVWNQFIEYADKQQNKRLLWAAIGILGHGTIFTILTFGTVLLLGNDITLLAITCFTMTMVVVVNLAALPTKYTVPIFFLSLLIDLGVIISAIILHQW
jgi:hypothetical protein